MTKQILEIRSNFPQHWVGDGFPVRTVISPRSDGPVIGPIIMMDYVAPYKFPPVTQPRGVDSHPHKGFETVTIVFSGEVEHRDSAGNSGKVGPGEVQWMTAGSGVLHEEKHSKAMTESGGVFEMAQLWVNLPAVKKSTPPAYQTITNDQLKAIDLSSGVRVQLIAGSLAGGTGAATTHTPITMAMISLQPGAAGVLTLPRSQSGGIFVRNGAIVVDTEQASQHELAVFGTEGTDIPISSSIGAELLLIAGEPIDEPIAAYGPFVMNTAEEIQETLADFRSGKFGSLD